MCRLDESEYEVPHYNPERIIPKYKVAAGVALGQSFLEAGYVDESIDTLKDLIEGYEIKNDTKFTEMTYWYGRALEKKGEIPAAQKAYSAVAQSNFNYRDVQAR